MSVRTDGSIMVRTIQNHEEEFLEALGQSDPLEVSKEMAKNSLLPNKVVDIFASLDENVDPKLKTKYLFQQLCKVIKTEEGLWNRLSVVLSSLGENVEKVCLLVSKEEPLSYTKKLGEDDMSKLMSIFVDVAHRWKEIGAALKLSTILLDEYEEIGLSFPELLHKVLMEWVTGKNDTDAPATLMNLKQVLECSDDDGLSIVAQKIEEKLMPAEKEIQEEKLEVCHQSSDTNVSEGRLVLLEVQVNSKTSPLSFQWQRARKPLANNEEYSDVTSPVLVIKASANTEGDYSCLVRRREEELASRVINLSVISSRQDSHLMNLYFQLDKALETSWPSMGTYSISNLNVVSGTASSRNQRTTYKEMFGYVEDGTRIVVRGSSGVGKTTLACKLSTDWSKGDVLKKTKFLFLITTGMLEFHKNINSLTHILRPFYSGQIKQDQILGEIERGFGKGVCFVIDGLDSYYSQLDDQTFIPNLIKKATLREAVVIVTSHSIKAAAFSTSQRSNLEEIELVKLTSGQIFQFVDHFSFQAPSTTSKDVDPFQLTDYIHTHGSVLDLVSLPAHITMACTVHQQQDEYNLTSLTGLYKNFSRGISQNSDGARCFRKACKVAFEMTVKKRRVICQHGSEASLSQLSSNLSYSDPFISLFFADPMSELLGLEKAYMFLHQMLQEFLAAYYIAELATNEQESILRQYTGEVHMQMVWKFFCGLSHLQGISAVCTGMLLPKAGLFEVQCAFESQKESVCNSVIESGKGLVDLSDHTLTAYDLNALCNVIATASVKVTSLCMDNCSLGDRLVQEMMSQVQNDMLESLTKLSLAGNNISSLGVTALTEGLKHPNSLGHLLGNKSPPREINHLNLVELNLSGNNLSSDGAITLVYELKESLLNLRVLNLSNNYIGSGGAGAIIKDLIHLKRLEDLDLSKNSIDSISALAIVRALTRARHNLRFLRLEDNLISDDIQDMEEVLSECQTNLEVRLSSSTVLHSAFHSRQACCSIS